ncbi:vitelline membrane outer layer protein 1 homolog [Mercenaria mercenaria]|uniref:vitelline membrane outer layer protein 1 homolog n=1 Tax=Mercenaria mercenaria TaxID=6596 RepID=UPI00234E4028|nr:vitelline membrane outer layer protein 1 homolog [Mercenaria mercenaria]
MKMDVFIRGIFVLAFTFLVGQAICGLDREFLRSRDEDVEEFDITSDDITIDAGVTEDFYTEDRTKSSVAESEENVDNSRVVKTLAVTNGGPWGKWGPAQYCPKGSYAIGYDMKIEPKQKVDNTALNAIKLVCESLDGDETGEITSTQGHWGSWVGRTLCPSESGERLHLTSFDLQVQPKRGAFKDDTAANYVKFRCRCGCGHQYEINKPPGHGLFGTWGAWSDECPHGTSICGIKTKVEKPRGPFRDDTALNDVKFYCCK